MENKNTILVVDDMPENIDVLFGALKRDYKVKAAPNGEKALEIAQGKNPPDLILLDIMMPGMDGYEVCQRLRENEKGRKIPVIFLTAKSEKEAVVKGFESGGQDYVTKPFDLRELTERVRTQLELKQQREALQSMNQILEEKVKKRTQELNEANRRLEAANQELMTLDDAKNQFLELISHEIRTPLNGILGVTDLLKEMLGEEPELAEFIDMLKESADRLEAFSTTALVITQLKAKHAKISRSRIPALFVLATSFEVLQEKAAKKSISFREIVADKNLELDIDQDLITRAYTSILDNAIKYSPEFSEITCLVSKCEEGIVYEVIDQGKGFSQEAPEKLFKPLGLGESHSDQNVGLSLLAAKLIMEAHGGRIEVMNQDHGGAAVRLVFPLGN